MFIGVCLFKRAGARVVVVVVFSIFMKYEEDSTFHFKKGSRGVVQQVFF